MQATVMKGGQFLAIFLVTTLLSPMAIATSVPSGVDQNPDESEVPFTVVERTAPSVDGKEWTIEVRMNNDESSNNTVFTITTQVCTNDGVCDPPVSPEMVVDGQNYATSIIPKSDHTYVNWRVGAQYENGDKENFPQGDWYKTWSSCWFNDNQWGGVDTTGDGCDIGGGGDTLPGFVLPTMLASMVMAVAYYRRD